MKAIVYTQYGPPDVLHMQDVPKPTPQADEVLLKVHATTVTAGDCNARGFSRMPASFKPIGRLMFGLRGPKAHILGKEVAGEIAAVGAEVTDYKPGDQVFTMIAAGAYAEYVCVRAKSLVRIEPGTLSYEEAVSIPFGAATALSFLRDMGEIKAGQKVLINGASGNVGVYAVQLAKHFGAHVTGVCSTRNIDLVQSLGADRVIDYKQEDFTRGQEKYDLIVDTVGNITFGRASKVLTDEGKLLLVAGGLGSFVQMLWLPLVTRTQKQMKAGIANVKVDDLAFARDLMVAGEIKAVIDQRYPLEHTAEAHRHADSGRKRGSVVITVAQNGTGS